MTNDMASREMTLLEWVSPLNKSHRAYREFQALTEAANELREPPETRLVDDGRNPEREFWERVFLVSLADDAPDRSRRALEGVARISDIATDEWLKRWGAEGVRR